jgi:acyl-CoA dehydrogenase
MTLSTSLIFVAVIWAFAYWRAPLWGWTVACALMLLVASVAAPGFSLWLLLAWLGWGVLAACNSPAMRQQLFSRRLLRLYRAVLPEISATEREALEAGTVWWEAELFSGRPDWQRLLAFPAPRLSAEEQAFLDGPVESLCRMLDDWQITDDLKDLPPEVWQFIKEQRFWGIVIPKDYGGLGLSALAHSSIIEKIATRSVSAAVNVMVPNSLGPAELLLKYGTEVQKDKYLQRLATGKEIPCFALTGPWAGSDAGAMTDVGIVCYGDYQGQQVLGIRLTWEKRYITMGPIATLLGLAFKLYDPDHLLGENADIGITLALIPTSHPGVNIGNRHHPAKQAFQNGPNSGVDVFIPMDWVIGGRERVGQGWRMLMNCLSEGRAISLPALSSGAVKLCARVTGAYARIRKQFRLPIAKLEGIEEPLARLASEAYTLEAARRLTAAAVDSGQKPAVISALLKYQATERMRRCINDAMDVHGGRAIIVGPSNYLWSPYEAIPVGITVEGANILTRTMIVFGQGAIRCHPWLLREMEAVAKADETEALESFDTAITGHAGYLLRNAARALFQNLTAGIFNRAPVAGAGSRWYQQLERAAVSFSITADAALMTLGGGFKRREKISGRFADALSELYLLSCILRRFEDDGRPTVDLPLIDWTVSNGLYRVQMSLDGILQNLPFRPLAWLLRFMLFPWGMRRRPPTDELGHKVAALITVPSQSRDRLTGGMFINDDPEDKIGCLEHALRLVMQIEPIERKLRDAVRDGRLPDSSSVDPIEVAEQAGIIDSEEAKQLQETRRAVRKAIDVDDFPAETLSPRMAQWWHAAEVA